MSNRTVWCCENHAERVEVMNALTGFGCWEKIPNMKWPDRVELSQMIMYGEVTPDEARELIGVFSA